MYVILFDSTMNKQVTIFMYDKYSNSFDTILKLLIVSDQTYYAPWCSFVFIYEQCKNNNFLASC